MEKIEVFYKPFPGIGPYTHYHKYLVYTDSDGNQFATRGYPEVELPLDEQAANALATEVSLFVGYSPFGNIKTYTAAYNAVDFEDDYPKLNEIRHIELITQGTDLSMQWQSIVQTMENINDGNFIYIPSSQNSNTVVDYALSAAGLPQPELDDLAVGEYLSIGSGRGLVYNEGEFIINTAINNTIEFFKTVVKQMLDQTSPLVLDLDGDGIELTSLNSSGAVYWDIDQDGFAEASAWVAPDDGLLAIDLNEDGAINNHGELFGNGTGHANGFLALASYDSNNDGKLLYRGYMYKKMLFTTNTRCA